MLKPLKHPSFKGLFWEGWGSLLGFFLVELLLAVHFLFVFGSGKNLNRFVEKLSGWVTKRIADFNRLLSVLPTQLALS